MLCFIIGKVGVGLEREGFNFSDSFKVHSR